jgi:uncharacterized protein YecE (DUF72 family)
MKLFTGTSGYSYKEWQGSFYPEKIAASEMLHYYAERLPAVEINNTFYRFPKTDLLESWAEQVPDSFRFSLKASRKITHSKPLVESEEATEYLFRTVSTLGERLGVILFQLPPYFRKNLDKLKDFLELIPEDKPAAFEFRHQSWFEDDVSEALRKKGCALCVADTDGDLDTPLEATTDWGYMRLRRSDYSEKDLKEWAKRIASQNWERAYVFFKHEDEGAGPKLAKRFLEMTETKE